MNSHLERIRTLIDFEILDTAPEEMFDGITRLASSICGMPIALVSLLDVERQFFKSGVGLEATESPIEYSFCKFAIAHPNEIFIVEDARKDIRFKDNPFVLNDPNIVSYYGVPLNSQAGIAYGTLCVIDTKVRILTDEQIKNLKILSKQVEYLIESRKNHNLLVDYRSKIEMYSKNMEEFAFLAAHDLKAPVRAIDAFIKILDKDHKDQWNEKDRQHIDFILESTTRMSNLIQDLLEYSKSNVDVTKVEQFDVKELVADIFRSLTYPIKTRKPQLICDEMPSIVNSKIAFTILFNNLLSNAIKYQFQGATPIIKVSCREDVNHWIFSIADNGMGIEKEYYGSIFEPFKRLHANSEYSGNGLGLAACLKIVDNLEGRISVNSILGTRTTFTVTIPKN